MTKSIKALAILGVVAGLGVATLPLSSYAEEDKQAEASTNMTVNAEIKDFISIDNTTGGENATDRTVLVGDENGIIINNADVETGTGTVNVKTNNPNGFTLKIKPAETTNVNMVAGSYSIPAGKPEKGKSAWGFKLSTETDWSSFAAVEAEGRAAGAEQTLKSDYTTPDANGANISIDFGVTADGHQQVGTYSTVVTLTAVTNPTPAQP